MFVTAMPLLLSVDDAVAVVVVVVLIVVVIAVFALSILCLS